MAQWPSGTRQRRPRHGVKLVPTRRLHRVGLVVNDLVVLEYADAYRILYRFGRAAGKPAEANRRRPVRKPALVVAAMLALIGATAAYAATDSVTYKASISPKRAGRTPVNITYSNTVTVGVTPAGTQPDRVFEIDL